MRHNSILEYARFRSERGTVQGWLSAHVYLCTALVVIFTLHTGFELGWNVHTLAYLLMLLVVASGFYGVVYLRVPRAQALSLPDDLFALIDRSVAGTRLGGGFFRILSGRDRACPTAAAVRARPEAAKKLSGDIARLDKAAYGLLLKNQMLERARRDMRHKAVPSTSARSASS